MAKIPEVVQRFLKTDVAMFGRLPNILRSGFELEESWIPSGIAKEPARPVLDLAQGGWAVARAWQLGGPNGISIDQAAPTHTVEAAEQMDRQFLLVGLHIAENGAGAAVAPSVRFTMIAPGTGGITIAVFSATVTLGSIIGNNTTLPGGPVIFPPGFGMQAQVTTADANVNVDVLPVYGILPTGFKTL